MSATRFGGGGPWRGRTAIAAILLAVACRCESDRHGREAVPRSPEEAALRVFELARAPDPDLADLKLVMSASLIDEDRAAAFEALAALGNASRPEVLAKVPLTGVDRTALDLGADLPGGGSARYSFQAEADPEGGWRIVSILAPGIDWPPRSRKGSGLSVSSPGGETSRSR
jgi:hypothetical protein